MKRVTASKQVELEYDEIYYILDDIHGIQNRIDKLVGYDIDADNMDLLDYISSKLDEICIQIYKYGYRG